MKNVLSLLLISGVSLALVNCGGSGGGGGGGGNVLDNGGGGTTGYLADTSGYFNSDDELILRIVNGDDVIVAGDGSAAVNGTVMAQGTYNAVQTDQFVGAESYFAAVYNVDGAPKAFYSFLDGNELNGSGTLQPLQSDGTDYNWEYVEVRSGYVKADGTSASPVNFNFDGTINYDGNGNWTAELGPVSLDGTINGYKVSGDMAFDDGESTMSGTFDGVDGYDPNNEDFYSTGGFAGANADGSETVAGVWFW